MNDGAEPPPVMSDRQVALLAAIKSIPRYSMGGIDEVFEKADRYLEWLQR